MKLKEFLKNKIPESKLAFVPSSFDVIGSICTLEIKDEARKYEKEIGDSILRLNKNIKSVFKKASARKGKFRTYKLKLIAGENNKIASVNLELL
jgi:tRNA (guanine37-N1)-methyltransferase